MKSARSSIVAILVFLALCFFCLRNHVEVIPETLQSASTEALATAGVTWATVSMDGRDATLEGTAPSIEGVDQAAAVVAGVTGIRVVNNNLGFEVEPYELGARFSGDSLILRGFVPTERVRTRILRAAANVEDDITIIDELEIREDVPDPQWSSIAEQSLGLLAGLNNGEWRLSPQDLVLRGTAQTEDISSRVSAALLNVLPDGYTSTVDIVVAAPAPELSAADCQTVLNELARKQVQFVTNSALIVQESESILDEVASVAGRCPAVRIEIGGHTDSLGDEAYNMNLSQLRAAAVKEYLISQGVPSARLNAVGYGETQPIAANSTASGRATNRRIEFKIER